jgi:TPR repeat protein
MKKTCSFLHAVLLIGMLTNGAMASDQAELKKAVDAIVAGDMVRGTELLRLLAEHGNAEAQAHLWSILKTTDEKQATMWLMRSAENGYAESIFAVGLMYLHGNGVAEDPQQALQYLKRAADAGIVPAQRHLGVLYRTGPNSLQDDSEAARWLRAAADAGDAEAQFQYAGLFRYGYGVKPDIEAMKKWLKLAAQQGHVQAAVMLAEISR